MLLLIVGGLATLIVALAGVKAGTAYRDRAAVLRATQAANQANLLLQAAAN